MIAEWLAALLSAAASLAAIAPASTAEHNGLPSEDDVRLVSLIAEPQLAEISGIALSRRHEDLLWAHNDSDDGALLHAVATNGRVRASFRLRDIENFDFEDMAAFELDGEPYLLIADVGDNGGVRRELQLHVLREPATIEDAVVDVEWTLRFQWPDGPRDCEAVAVDPERGEVLLVSKKRVPPELFRLPLRVTSDDLLVAEPAGVLRGIEQPTANDLERNPKYGRYRSQVTAMDISADGRQLAILNYRQAYLYRRDASQPWAAATALEPVAVQFPWLAQAEAISFDPQGRHLWITTEHLPAPLLRLPIPKQDRPAANTPND